MSGFSKSIEKAILNHIYCTDIVGTSMARPSAVFLSLHSADPTTDTAATTSTELVGGSYSRKPITFTEANIDELSRAFVSNRATIAFSGLPFSDLTHIGFWDSFVGGNLLQSGNVLIDDATPSSVIHFNSGDSLTIYVATLKVFLN